MFENVDIYVNPKYLGVITFVTHTVGVSYGLVENNMFINFDFQFKRNAEIVVRAKFDTVHALNKNPVLLNSFLASLYLDVSNYLLRNIPLDILSINPPLISDNVLSRVEEGLSLELANAGFYL